MVNRRTVADFARDILMIGIFLLQVYIVVTFPAGLIAGVFDLLGGDLIDRIRPVVTIFAERFGDQEYSGDN